MIQFTTRNRQRHLLSRKCGPVRALGGALLVMAVSLFAVEGAEAQIGGTPASNQRVPQLRVENLVADADTTITVTNIPESSAGLRVLVGFSLHFAGDDVSADFGPGALIVPDLVVDLGADPPFEPTYSVEGSFPDRSIDLPVPPGSVGKTYYVQAFVEDPAAPGGGGWALSDGVAVTVMAPKDVTRIELNPPLIEAGVGLTVAFEATMYDSQGQMVRATNVDEVDFKIEQGSGSLFFAFIHEGRIGMFYRAPMVPGDATVRAVETISGKRHFAEAIARTVPGIPRGPIPMDANPSTLDADGVSTSIITAGPILDTLGHPIVDGEFVTLEVTGDLELLGDDASLVLPGFQVTTLGGGFSLSVRAGLTPGIARISARTERGEASGFVEIGLAEPRREIAVIVLTPESVGVPVDSEVELTAELRDSLGGFIAARSADEVDFELTAGAGLFGQRKLEEGRVTISYRAATAPEAAIVVATERASGFDFADSSQITSVPGLPTGPIALISDESSIPADGTSSTAIQGGPVQDVFGNVIPNGSLITLATSAGTLFGGDAAPGIPGFQRPLVSGFFSATLQSGEVPTTALVSAASVDGNASGSVSVEFVEVPPVISSVVMLPESTTLEVDGEVVLTAELRDEEGVFVPAVSSAEIVFAQPTGNGSLGSRSLNGGRVTVIYRASTTPEVAAIVATEKVSGLDHRDSSSVTSVPGPPAGNISLFSNDASLPADGLSTTTVQGGPIRDDFGNLIPDGSLVTIATTAGTLITIDADPGTPGLQRALVSGFFAVVLQSGKEATTATVTAMSVQGSALGSLPIEFTEPEPVVASLFLSPESSTLEVDQEIELTAELRDDSGALVPAQAIGDVQFGLTQGSGVFGAKVLDGGRIRVSYRAATSPEVAIVTATETVSGSSFSGLSTLTSEPGPPAGAIPMSSSDPSIPADGNSTTTIQGGPVRDSLGNVVPDGTLVTIAASAGTLLGGDADGSRPGLQRALVAGSFSVILRSGEVVTSASISAGSVSGTAVGNLSVDFTEPEPVVAAVLMTPESSTVEVDTVVTLTAELRDGEGLFIPASSVTDVNFNRIQGSGVLGPRTLNAGRVSVTYRTATSPEVASVVARETVSGTNRSDASSVTGIPGPPAGAFSMFATDGSIPADGDSTTTIQGGPVRDSFGNVVPDGSQVTVLTSAGSLVAPDVDPVRPGLQRPLVSGFFNLTLQSGETATTALVSGASVEGSATGSVSVEFTEVEPVVAQIVLSPKTKTVAVDEEVTLTAELRDDEGMLIPASSIGDVLFSQTVGSGTISAKSLSGGRVTISFRAGTAPEMATIVATEKLSGLELRDTATVTSVPGAPSGGIAMSAGDPSLPADGSSSTTVQGGPLRDIFGNRVPDGTLVTVATTAGSLLGTDADSGTPGLQRAVVSGGFTVVLQSGETPTTAMVSSRSVEGNATGSVAVEFTELEPVVTQVVLTPETATPAVGEEVVLVAELRDEEGALIPAQSIGDLVFTKTQGSGIVGSRVLSGGRVRVTYQAATTPEIATVVATEMVSGSTLNDSSTITSVPGDPAGPISMFSTDSSLPADGTSTTTIQGGPVRDSFGNLVSDGTLVTLSTSAGDLVANDVDPGTSGLQRPLVSGFFAAVLRSSETATTAQVRADSVEGTATGTVSVEFTDPEPEVASVVLTPDSSTVDVDEEVVLTAELRDDQGGLIPADSVTDVVFAQPQGTGSIGTRTLDNGRVRVTYKAARTPEIATIAATEKRSGLDRRDTVSVTSVPAAPAGSIAMSAGEPSIPADGKTTTSIQGGPVRDAFGNVIPNGKLVTVATSAGRLIASDADASRPGLQRPLISGRFGVNLESGTAPTTAVVVATSVEGTASGSVSVEFTEIDPTVAQVILTPDSSTVDVDDVVNFTAELRDAQGEFLAATSSSDVVFSRTQGSGALGSRSLVSGRVRISYRVAQTPETASILARETVSGSNFSDSSLIVSLPGNPSGPFPMMAADSTLPADGISTTSIQGGPVQDRFGNAVRNGALVTVSTSAGRILSADADGSTPGVQRRTSSGFFSLILESGSEAATAVVSGRSVEGSATGSTTVVFEETDPVVTSVSVTPASSSRTAGSAAILTAVLRDPRGLSIPATSVGDINFAIASGSGTLSSKALVAGGGIRVTYTTSTSVEDARIVATEQVTGSRFSADSIIFGKPGAPSGTISLSCSPSSIPADGLSMFSVESGVLRDSFGNRVGDGELVTVAVTSGAIVATDLSALVGIQIGVSGGSLNFEVRSSAVAGDAIVTVDSISGTGSGECGVTYTEVPGAVKYSIFQAGTLPSPRSQMVTLYDDSSEKAYVMGGIGASLPQDILEVDFNGTFGSQIRVMEDRLNKSRYGAPAVWDSNRRVGYIFGGRENPIFTHRDILVFDPQSMPGQRVRRLGTDLLPFAVFDASAVWSAGEQVAYLFEGSFGSLRVLRFDPAANDGQRVTQVSDTVSGLYSRTSAVWDDSRGVAYLFGGSASGRLRDDILQFDPAANPGSRFTVLPQRLPSARTNTSASWDPSRKIAYISGGSTSTGTLDQVLTFDPSRSPGSQISLLGLLPTSVTRSSGFYVNGLRRLFLLGGFEGVSEDNTDMVLSFDVTGGPSCFVNILSGPTAYSASVYDTGSGRSYVFGGRDQRGFHDTVYEVDPAAPAGCQVQLLASDRLPTGRYSLAAAWSPGERVAYVFGGLESLGDGTDEILRFRPSANPGSRVQRLQDRLPRAIYNSSAVWDGSQGVAYLFDGSTSVTPLSVIRFDPGASSGNRVTEFGFDTIPGRLHASAVWDPQRRVAYLFGGSNGVMTLDEILEFDPSRPAGQRFATLSDTLLGGRSSSAVAWDFTNHVAYLFDGSADILEFDPSRPEGFQVILVANSPLPLSFASAAYDQTSQRTYVFGGLTDNGQYRSDIRCLVRE